MSHPFDDVEFAVALKDKVSNTSLKVLLFVNKFYTKIYVNNENNDWIELGYGELGRETRDYLKLLIKAKRVLILESASKDLTLEKPKFEDAQALSTLKKLDEWIKISINLTSGRLGEVKTQTKNKVMYDAAWRCQLSGCGVDLREHLTSSMSGNYSYYAHIVASSEDGPRGNSDSEKLADEPTNIMLLCDKCHRLIDKIEPHNYSVEILRDMREKSVNEVKRLLDCLKFPEAEMIVIGGKIEGQAFIFNSQDAEEAMWRQEMKSFSQPHRILKNPDYFSASNNPNYWVNIFELFKSEDFPILKKILHKAANDYRPKILAIFPLHGMSVLILSGRIIGDASSIVLFQFHRQKVFGKGKQWAWPEVVEPQGNKFRVTTHKDNLVGESEALLLVNITAKIPESELPEYLFNNGYTLPTMEITLDECSFNAISHPKDLEHLGEAIDSAYKKIQDEWRLQKVHLIMVAPTTACVRLGQKMQARHHADFILYERKPGTGNKGPFEPTVQIGAKKVSLIGTDQEIDIS